MYNGWKNYETWNIALWINNDEPLYRTACGFMENNNSRSPYRDFVKEHGLTKTPDGVGYKGRDLDYVGLNEMMKEL